MAAAIELAIIGAGPAAASAARAAARHGTAAVLIAPDAHPRPGILELLGAATRPALRVLGLDRVIEGLVQPLLCTEFSWGRAEAGARRHAPGAGVVDRAVLDPVLLAASASGVQRLDRFVTGIRPGSSGAWSLSTADARGRREPEVEVEVEVERVLIATGRGGRLAHRVGGVRRSRHPMVAAIRRLEEPGDLTGVMRVDPTPNGWWYAMGDGRRAIVGFVTDADLLAPGTDRGIATWERERAGRSWIPDAIEVELRPAAVSEATGLPDGVDVIGDAALAVDPLSGHGLRLALESGLRAVISPSDYRPWLDDERRRHAEAERRLYVAEGRFRSEPFWQRRIG